MKKSIILFFLLVATGTTLPAQTVQFNHTEKNKEHLFTLQNEQVTLSVAIKNGILFSDTLRSNENWTATYHRRSCELISDAGFNIRVVYNAWRAPGKENNADNPVDFGKDDFRFDRYALAESTGNERQMDLYFKGTNNPFELRITYKLDGNDYFVRRKLVIKDPTDRGHFIDRIDPAKGIFAFVSTGGDESNEISIGVEALDNAYSEKITSGSNNTKLQIPKEGGFGQPVAFTNGEGGGFTGLEYPTGTTEVKSLGNNMFHIDSYQYFGEKAGTLPVESNWQVMAITPQPYVKKWFYDYVDRIRVAPAKPYTLYNSWYDLRSPAFANRGKNGIPQQAVMNEENSMRIIRLLRENMIKKHGIKLDAFVLDDGWDIYESDWKLRTDQFPNGLKPLSDTLAKTGTRLGIWFGPIGGYSFAMKRVKWMGEHGYEVTGHKYEYGSAMLCLAGKNYSRLFRKRITDFTRDDKVGFYKWDGIQFACSEPGHGHPVGIYSRRAIMESVIDKCNAVRAIDSDVYLNITSGTWLSPWWVQYANQIWMDAADYAFSDVPSLNRRDNAMTYRDYALYNDLKMRKLWFPVANLMTHGIIKGRLENISKGGEPIDRFTNNAVLYFARGVSMWELYISPDILTDKEWNALSQSVLWANDKQDVMATTFMQGGNPALGESYAYLHFKGKKGVIAVRNPKVEDDELRITLTPEDGLDEDAVNLVIEQVYPYRRILPQLYGAGSILTIPLDGYETAVFHVYPLESSRRPLLADARFTLNTDKNVLNYTVYETGPDVKFLNPQLIGDLYIDGKKAAIQQLKGGRKAGFVEKPITVNEKENKKSIRWNLEYGNNPGQTINEVALLLKEPATESDFPKVTLSVNGKSVVLKKQSIKGKWIWYSAALPDNSGNPELRLMKNGWKGTAEIWVNKTVKLNPVSIKAVMNERIKDEVMPPLPYAPDEKRNYIPVKKTEL